VASNASGVSIDDVEHKQAVIVYMISISSRPT
jgi:hypothetical protein